ncbi:hypothetical protein DPMN_005311 [Dreissena polymorpha]|uniref:Uncharacterized protein n=1 Tax=Dreissena polymorpha TaxID=45954 RepID=A0A9D4RWD4_DREPO|nr:hypothetical protein DPMN_005311 [Dreissena polymorpha]
MIKTGGKTKMTKRSQKLIPKCVLLLATLSSSLKELRPSQYPSLIPRSFPPWHVRGTDGRTSTQTCSSVLTAEQCCVEHCLNKWMPFTTKKVA